MVEFVLEKKARKPVILDIGDSCNLCDYFVICSGETGTQVKAIYEEVLRQCERHGLSIHHWEDDKLSRWILIDLFDVILHIFIDEARDFYNLEYLWRYAKRINPSINPRSKDRGI